MLKNTCFTQQKRVKQEQSLTFSQQVQKNL